METWGCGDKPSHRGERTVMQNSTGVLGGVSFWVNSEANPVSIEFPPGFDVGSDRRREGKKDSKFLGRSCWKSDIAISCDRGRPGKQAWEGPWEVR